MRKRLESVLKLGREETFTQQSAGYLVVLDQESYPAFVSEGADYLDLLRHLCLQTDACTVAMWEVSDKPLQVAFILADTHLPAERLAASGHHVFSNGWVRSSGRLVVASREHLLACAQDRRRDSVRTFKVLGERHPGQLLLVPPGVYAVTVFSGKAHNDLPDTGSGTPTVDYTVVLRHHPHPRPRFAPVRLRGLLAPGI